MHAYFFNARGRDINNYFFWMAVSFGIEDARLGSVCYCVSENKFLISCLFMPRVVSVLDGPVPSKGKRFPNTLSPRKCKVQNHVPGR